MASSLDRQNAFVARYSPGLSEKYARNNYAFAALYLVLLILGIVACVLTARDGMTYVVTLVIGGAAVAAGWITARKARARWDADDRLAFAASDDGVVLPHVGLIPWAEITSITIFDHSRGPTGLSPASSTVQRVLGLDASMRVDLFVLDPTAVLARMPSPRKAHRVLDASVALTGFRGVWGQGMHDPTFKSATRVLANVAERRGIPVTMDLPKL